MEWSRWGWSDTGRGAIGKAGFPPNNPVPTNSSMGR